MEKEKEEKEKEWREKVNDRRIAKNFQSMGENGIIEGDHDHDYDVHGVRLLGDQSPNIRLTTADFLHSPLSFSPPLSPLCLCVSVCQGV